MALNMFECEKILRTFSGYLKDGLAETFPIRRRKSSELWLVHNSESHVEVYFNNYRFCLFHANIHGVPGGMNKTSGECSLG